MAAVMGVMVLDKTIHGPSIGNDKRKKYKHQSIFHNYVALGCDKRPECLPMTRPGRVWFLCYKGLAPTASIAPIEGQTYQLVPITTVLLATPVLFLLLQCYNQFGKIETAKSARSVWSCLGLTSSY